MLPLMRRRQAVIVTDENVARHHLAPLRASLAEHGIAQHAIVLPPGEGTKDLAHFGRLVDDILACGIERGTMLVALGGGVVGDIAGFAAATLLRGIDFVQIPTTLLAQVDSSVGGKTAINTRPARTCSAPSTSRGWCSPTPTRLATLPRREVRAGYGEIVKYGLIRDAGFLRLARSRGPRGVRPRTGGADPRGHGQLPHEGGDRRRRRARGPGDRALLNFGHTFGHALEAETGFGDRLLHGEAVALGHGAGVRFRRAPRARLGAGCAPGPPPFGRRRAADRRSPRSGSAGGAADRLLAHMGKDKKVRDGAITLILPRRIGDGFVMRDAPVDELRAFLAAAA